MGKVLVIDDDTELCELLDDYLSQEGFAIETVNDPLEGIQQALSGSHCLVVLDVMLPRMNGFEVLRRIRASSKIPILMLTARGDEVDRIVGLEIGADDYLPKPFSPRELVARLRAILRRTEQDVLAPRRHTGSLVVGDVVLNPGMRTVACAGKTVELTSIEFAVLEVLLDKVGQVVGREELARKALDRGYSAYDRSIDVHISSLRKKLGPRADGLERIKTVRNSGYLYVLGANDSRPS